MRKINKLIFIVIFFVVVLVVVGGILKHQENNVFDQSNIRHSCTIGVASRTATEDGRPLVWKTRDWINHQDTRIRFDTSQRYSVLMVSKIGSTWPVIGCQ